MKKTILYLSLAALVLAGCAKAPKKGTNEDAKRYFEAWKQVYYPNATRTPLGAYILEETPGTGASAGTTTANPFVRINYTVRSLDGTVQISTSEAMAKQLGNFEKNEGKNPYYGPVVLARGSAGQAAGVEESLAAMSVGGSRTVAIPGWLLGKDSSSGVPILYSTAEDYEQKVSGPTPLIYELELTETPASRHDLDECRMLEEHFSKCYSTSTGFTDISKKMNDYVENVDTTSWTGDKLFTSPYGLLMGTSKANGFISTPIYWMPESGEITVVLGGRPYGNDESVKGVLEFVNRFGTEKHEFELTADRRVVFHLNTEGKQFIIDIKPSARMYMDYLAIYEGVFTEEELGIAAGTRNTASKVIRRISKQNYTTDQTSYTFADLTPTSRFSYRIRAIGAEDISQWSDEQQFSFPATAISPVRIAETSGAVYDLRGVYVGNDLKRLRKGVYVIDGKKVVID